MELREHVKTHDEIRWTCEFCENNFKTQEEQKEHVEFKHGGNRNSPISIVSVSCEICGMTFQTAKDQAKHVDNEHGEFLDLSIPDFESSFLAAMTHKITPDDELGCPFCEEIFMTALKRDEHVMCHDVFLVSCEICKKSFKTIEEQEDHVQIEHRTPESISFGAGIFKFKSNFKFCHWSAKEYLTSL